MCDTKERIFKKYEDTVLAVFENVEKSGAPDAAIIHAMNDCIRVLHHIEKMREIKTALENKSPIVDVAGN